MRQRKQRKPDVRELVEAMQNAGAVFHFSSGGCLYVRGLASLLASLAEMFFNCDARALVAHIRADLPAVNFSGASRAEVKAGRERKSNAETSRA